MNWHQTIPGLLESGERDVHFGDAQPEALAATQDTIVAPLLHLGTIAATGPDTDAFLQGQLSNDLAKLNPLQAQLSSYNSPKGRMLAVLHLIRQGQGVMLELHRAVLEATLKRLRMYVLRSKTVLENVTEQRSIIGLAGPDAEALLEASDLAIPQEIMGCAWTGNTAVLRRRGERTRFTVHAPGEAAADLWSAFHRRATPVGTQAWRLLDIEAGVPVVYPETSDHFVPQMCNLDALGGISFSKGCYTGQEIVARIHYRGAVKRRMSALKMAQEPPAAGTQLEPGEVVDSAPHPDGGCVALVVGP